MSLTLKLASLVVIGIGALIVAPSPTPQPAPVEAPAPAPEPAKPSQGARFSRIAPDGEIRHGYYRIEAEFPKWKYVAWEYTPNPDGSISFIDRSTRRGVVVSPPFAIKQEYAAKGWKPKD